METGRAVVAESDTQLLARAAAGDHAAFGVLFRRHANAVYNHCFRRTASWADAEDLTSAVFLEAWRSRSRLRASAGGSALPWLLGIATNMERNLSRSLRRHQRTISRVPPDPAGGDPADDVAAKVDAERQMRAALQSLALSTRELDVLSLCDWDGLTYAEAAIALDIPVGTVRSRLSRARERLRSALAEHSETPGFERSDSDDRL